MTLLSALLALTAARFSDVVPDDVDSGHDDVIRVPAGAAAAGAAAPPHVLQVRLSITGTPPLPLPRGSRNLPPPGVPAVGIPGPPGRRFVV